MTYSRRASWWSGSRPRLRRSFGVRWRTPSLNRRPAPAGIGAMGWASDSLIQERTMSTWAETYAAMVDRAEEQQRAQAGHSARAADRWAGGAARFREDP